ncbi:MAG: class I SAM-dependent methyltransferase [Candidatus Goldiibacteriota bacterium]
MGPENRRIFNGLAGTYVNKWCAPGRERERIKKIAEAMGLEKGMKVLEPGCGKGEFSPFILEHIKENGFLYLADVSEKMLQCAEENTEKFENIKILRCCACDTGIKKGSLDAVAAFNCFPHFYPKQKFINCFMELLKENGILVIAHSRPMGFINKMHRQYGFDAGKYSLPDKRSMNAMLEKAGLKTEKYINKGYYLLKARKIKRTD